MSVEQLAATLQALQQQALQLDERIKELKAEIVAAHTPGDRISINGQPAYEIVQQHRFDSKKAAQTLPADVQQRISKTVLDATLARQHLTDMQLAGCQTVTAPFLRTIT